MASDNPLMCCPVVITSSNRNLDFICGTTEYTAAVPTGTYYDPFSLASTLQTAMADEWGSADFTVSVSTASSPIGKVEIVFDAGIGTHSLPWSTGTNASTSIGTVLGFVTSADDTVTSTTYTSDYQVPGAWWSPRPPATDHFDRRELTGGDGRRTLDGTDFKRLVVAKPRRRHVEFVRIAPELTLSRSATGANTNRAFEDFWVDLMDSASGRVRYFADQTDSGTSTDYFLNEPISLFDPVKWEDQDVETYAFAVDLLRKES